MRSYEDVFCAPWAAFGDAHGRVNVLGEHTDYNGGFVLPIAIAQRARVSIGAAAGEHFVVYSAQLDRSQRFTIDHPPADHFASYVYGCIKVVAERGVAVPPLRIHVDSNVPMGVGLSSSAALEVAVLRAVCRLLRLPIDDVLIAQLAQRAEHEYAHVNCGIMDQLAASLADEQHMLFVDTRSLERRRVPLPAQTEIVVIDSGTARTLATSGYNQRRAECEQAARCLGVRELRDVADPRLLERLSGALLRRARHVVTENARVLRALGVHDAAEFGSLLNDSHRSLSLDYEVSTPALDRLASLMQSQPDVYGARLTGAGFGGACVGLCRRGTAAAVAAAVLDVYDDAPVRGRRLVPADGQPVLGAETLRSGP